MDGSQRFLYEYDSDTYSADSADSADSDDSTECSEEEGYEKQFQINQGMMYMTSCNINQDIIPLVLQGKLDSDKKCICYTGTKDNPGNINLNGVYDIYCDFLSYTSNSSSHQFSIGSILTINIDEFNCNTYNDTISTDGIVQCPTKMLIPINTVNHTSSSNYKNTLNTDTIYITSILPTKISKLTVTFSILDMTNGGTTPSIDANDIFIIKLILKKTENTTMSLLNKQNKSKIGF